MLHVKMKLYTNNILNLGLNEISVSLPITGLTNLSVSRTTIHVFFSSSIKKTFLFKTRGSQEPVIAHLVFNLTSTFFGNISDNSFFGSFNEIFTTGNASHL